MVTNEAAVRKELLPPTAILSLLEWRHQWR